MDNLQLSPEVAEALQTNKPIVALESTVIAHGLPFPRNIEVGQELEAIIRTEGAVPATIAIIEGQPKAGLSLHEIERIADEKNQVMKISRRDFGYAIARRLDGATTVAATMIIAHLAGIRIFATGGIGGVHRGDTGDVSADLPELGQTAVAVVCAGAKSILDLPRTLEWLETVGVPVIGYGTDEFPAFYTRYSGLQVPLRADTPSEVAMFIKAQWGMGLLSGVLITVPVPESAALTPDSINVHIEQALREADEQKIIGKAITPFLLSRIAALSGGESLEANLALLRNNARVAAQIAIALND